MPDLIESHSAENRAFYEKIQRSFRDLCERARIANELHFALSLAPEFRGEQSPGWSTAEDAVRAFEDYTKYISKGKFTRFKARVMLAFYCQMAEASGYYEVPKNLLRVLDGRAYNLWPFQDLVERHRKTGAIIAPNANRVLRDLAGHAAELGLSELAEVFRDAFDPEIRNAYAHADYIVWADALRLRHRNGGHPRQIPWPEFVDLFHRGINLFHLVRAIAHEYVRSYDPARQIRGRLQPDDMELLWTVCYDPKGRGFSISGGPG